ncbi:MAG: hypothetical protein Q9M91_08965 [Candidatus Dojkabacteria bacterium]|nr:hypothetical protein [Candidatus Dojkabacteria bacterium]MDQ7021903.1 hypothetical protein [Candidatus Dojkabacteria bacterium]
MNKPITEIKSNTRLLNTIMNSELSLINRLDIILQIKNNLTILKEELSKKEFEEFTNLEEKINLRLQKITDPKFIQKLLEIFRKEKIKF